MPVLRPGRTPAFTLIELLTVLAIVAILSAIALGGVTGAKQRANIARTKSELAALSAALEDYRRLYGDYPQTGNFAQAPLDPGNPPAAPAASTAQVKLFNCLTGGFGPTRMASTDDRLAGPSFVVVGRFTLNGTLSNTFQVVTANAPRPPFKQEERVCFLDPWGHRYLYYYKRPGNAAAWQSSGYVLYSAGPDGAHSVPINQNTGVRLATQATNNADNIYAHP